MNDLDWAYDVIKSPIDLDGYLLVFDPPVHPLRVTDVVNKLASIYPVFNISRHPDAFKCMLDNGIAQISFYSNSKPDWVWHFIKGSPMGSGTHMDKQTKINGWLIVDGVFTTNVMKCSDVD